MNKLKGSRIPQFPGAFYDERHSEALLAIQAKKFESSPVYEVISVLTQGIESIEGQCELIIERKFKIVEQMIKRVELDIKKAKLRISAEIQQNQDHYVKKTELDEVSAEIEECHEQIALKTTKLEEVQEENNALELVRASNEQRIENEEKALLELEQLDAEKRDLQEAYRLCDYPAKLAQLQQYEGIIALYRDTAQQLDRLQAATPRMSDRLVLLREELASAQNDEEFDKARSSLLLLYQIQHELWEKTINAEIGISCAAIRAKTLKLCAQEELEEYTSCNLLEFIEDVKEQDFECFKISVQEKHKL